MTPRIKNHIALAPDAIKAMMAVQAAIVASGIEFSVLELVKLRASQINKCAFCIHMHTTEMRAKGETEMRIYMLNAWRESPLYSPRERAALAWTESLTNLAETGAPDEDFALVKEAFSESELVHLTLAIGAINLWNRLQVGLRASHPVDKARDAA
jgi:AhpD family alkylhydroperoxidase